MKMRYVMLKLPNQKQEDIKYEDINLEYEYGGCYSLE